LEVFVPTFNSERTLANCLRTIRKEIPNAKILIIDNESHDRTQKIAESFGVKFVSMSANLGMVRSHFCQLAEDDWFLMVDSDVLLGDGWFKTMLHYRDSLKNAGAISSTLKDKHTVLEPNLQSAHNCFQRWKAEKSTVRFAPLKNPKRMLTAAVLLKKEACEGFSSNAFCYEDYVLQKHVQQKGYDVYTVDAPAEHDILISASKLKLRAICQGASMREYGDVSFSHLLATMFYTPLIKAPFGCKRYTFMQYWNLFEGYIHASKYQNQHWG